ncbi:phenylalanyl-tRNA synthetase subunit beta [Salmonella enterica subsp. enterica]|uniref:Phenylalanine--tRNA ligase beta subunit n=1 Tax=Salmonella enterica I TaxID=59201 RepID=A0A379UPY1_SALET|nr:phenylalanyl-tRNA synthetase subunit beta [Salmonella enterica subsp. enterica]
MPKRATITLRRSKLDRLIGHHIADEQVSDILRRLGCEVTEGQDEWKAVAPTWRFDMEIEEDLVEEVARVYGYNNIPDEPIQAGLIMGTHREADLSLKRVKTMLNDKGYQEVITYSFVDPKVQQLIHPGAEALLLPNLSPLRCRRCVCLCGADCWRRWSITKTVSRIACVFLKPVYVSFRIHKPIWVFDRI